MATPGASGGKAAIYTSRRAVTSVIGPKPTWPPALSMSAFRREADVSLGSRPGHGYLCSIDYRDVVETLKACGVLRASISVQ
jgi:hypothetical protein